MSGTEIRRSRNSWLIQRAEVAEFITLLNEGMTRGRAAAIVGRTCEAMERAIEEHILFFGPPASHAPKKRRAAKPRPMPRSADPVSWSAISDIPWKEATARVASMRAV